MAPPVTLCLNLVNYSPALGGEVELESQIAGAAEAGFHEVGLDLASIDEYVTRGHGLGELSRLLERADVHVFELLGGLCSVDQEKSAGSAQHVARIAGELGSPWVLVTFASPLSHHLAASFSRCCSIVARQGSRVSCEFAPFSPIGSIPAARALVQEVGDVAGVLVDTWHFFRGASTWEDLENTPLAELAYVHFDDALPMLSDDLVTETRNRRAMPGDGEFDLNRFAETLRRRDYAGVVSIEVLSDELRAVAPAEVARRAWSTTERFWC